MISFYLQFEIDDYTGDALTYHEVEERHFTQIHALQTLAHKHFDSKLAMNDFIVSNYGILINVKSFYVCLCCVYAI